MKRLYECLKDKYDNYIAPFLWLHNEDDELIVNELKRIHECKIGAVCLESRTHDDFCGEEWWSDVSLILNTCRELGMKVWILDDKHFPSGYANGIFKERFKELQMWNITEFHVDVCGPVKDGAVMTDIWKAEDDDEIIGVVALRRVPDSENYTGEVYNLTDNIANGMVYFDLPEGVFSIVILVKSRAGMADYSRIFCDKLSSDAVEAYIQEVYEQHYKHFKDEFGKTLIGFFSDEPAFMNNTKNKFFTPIGEKFMYYPWHENVMSAMKDKFGNAAIETICGIWFNFDDDRSKMAREAYMNIITQLYSENFSGKIGKWCEEHGIMYIGHVVEDNNAHVMTGNGAGHYFRAIAGQHMSGIDVVLHQIIPGLTEYSNTGAVCYKQMDNKFFHYVLAKLASGAASVQENKNGRAMCEIFGAYGWVEGTKVMKYLTDHMLVRGINYFVPHAFSPKKNDEDCPPNFYAGGKNPQYKYFVKLMEYQNRMCHMLNGGERSTVCALLYDAESRWSTNDFYPLEDVAKLMYDNQLDYDIVSFDDLEKCDKYSVIIVPYTSYISPERYTKLRKYSDKVICTGTQMTENFKFVHMDHLLEYMEKYRELSISSSNNKYIRYCHYIHEDAELYMISNEDIAKDVSARITFKKFNGGNYIIYDAFENKIVKRYSANGEIDITLHPYNALTVVILNEDVDDNIVAVYKEGNLEYKELQCHYEIEICREDDLTGFKPYKTTRILANMTGRSDLPYFSGNMKYKTVFNSDNCEFNILDLGYVGETAEVTLNGTNIGVRLFPPYEFDMSGVLKQGENELEILVTNSYGYHMRDVFSKWMMFEPSGLIGPVIVKTRKSIV